MDFYEQRRGRERIPGRKSLVSKGEVVGVSLECNRNVCKPHSPELNVLGCSGQCRPRSLLEVFRRVARINQHLNVSLLCPRLLGDREEKREGKREREGEREIEKKSMSVSSPSTGLGSQ